MRRRVPALRGPILAVAGMCLAALAYTALVPASRTRFQQRSLADDASHPSMARASAHPTEAPTGDASYRHTRWHELAPTGWDRAKQVGDLQRHIRGLSDADPRATALLETLKRVWAAAPTNPAFHGTSVRIAGYVVPIDGGRDGVETFLLVYAIHGAAIEAYGARR